MPIWYMEHINIYEISHRGARGISFVLIMPRYLLCVWQYENGHKVLVLIYCPINNYSSLLIDYIFPLSFYLSLSGDISVNLESEQFMHKKLKASFKENMQCQIFFFWLTFLCVIKRCIVLVFGIRRLTILSESYQIGKRGCPVAI